jgi:hypothetical protein
VRCERHRNSTKPSSTEFAQFFRILNISRPCLTELIWIVSAFPSHNWSKNKLNRMTVSREPFEARVDDKGGPRYCCCQIFGESDIRESDIREINFKGSQIKRGARSKAESDQTGNQLKSGARTNGEPGQTGRQIKSGTRSNGEPGQKRSQICGESDQTRSQDKRGPRTNGTPSC